MADLLSSLWSLVTLVSGASGDANPDVVGKAQLLSFPTSLFLGYTVVLLIIQHVLRRVVVEPSVRYALKVLVSSQQPSNTLSVSAEVVTKFCNSFMDFWTNFVLGVFGVAAFQSQSWLVAYDASLLWMNQPNNVLSPEGVFTFYILTGAVNFQSFLSMFIAQRSKDFWEMVIHHAVTTILIIVSYNAGMVRIGLAIMILFNFADPPLHIAKMAKYISEECSGPTSSRFAFLADIFFAIFTVIFIVSRGVIFPIMLWASLYREHDTLAEGISNLDSSLSICILMLFVLCVLQYYWIILIIKVLVEVCFRGKALDENLVDEGKKER